MKKISLLLILCLGSCLSAMAETELAKPKATTKCSTGYTLAKTAISLVNGDTLKCVNKTLVTQGKQLFLNSDSSCYACHYADGVAPVSSMNVTLKAQHYTLSVADILSSFEAHASEMEGATITSAQAKAISQYLQTTDSPPPATKYQWGRYLAKKYCYSCHTLHFLNNHRSSSEILEAIREQSLMKGLLPNDTSSPNMSRNTKIADIVFYLNCTVNGGSKCK